MKKIECIKDKYGSLIPVDKISYISQSHWVSIDGERKDIDHNTLELLRCIFKEIKMEDCIQEKTADKSGSTWSEEDMAIIDDAILFIQEFQKSDRCKNESDMQNSVTCERFLIFLKDKVAPQSKQEWSEEVEAAISLLKDIAEEQEKDYCPYNANNLRKAAQYLETCRPHSQWKPSDEQIKAIRLARSFVTDDFDEHPTLSEILIELEAQLKKLREE